MKILKLQTLVFLESELFNVSVNTRQERELLFIAWEVMCMLNINTINHFIPLHSKKRCDDVGTVTLALCTLLMLETVAALPAVLPKPRCDTHLACTTALLNQTRGCSQLLSADPARWFSRLHTPGPFPRASPEGCPAHSRSGGNRGCPPARDGGALAGAQGLCLGRTGHCRAGSSRLPPAVGRLCVRPV